MSLYTYTIDLPNQKGKEGRITAKAEADAREQIVGRYPDGTNLILEAQPVIRPAIVNDAAPKAGKQPAKTAVKKSVKKAVKQSAKKAVKTGAKKVVAKGLTKLEKYLYLQHGKCFFCGENLSIKDASIEHLNPVSKGGSRTEDNEVACCATVNHTFGDMDLKRKFEFVLRCSNNFQCPKKKRETISLNQPKRIDPTTPNVTPENHGMPWTEKEEKQLLSRYNQKMSIVAMAQKHQRGHGAISARLEKLGKLQEESKA